MSSDVTGRHPIGLDRVLISTSVCPPFVAPFKTMMSLHIFFNMFKEPNKSRTENRLKSPGSFTADTSIRSEFNIVS